ncbi:hypothetical protein VTO73DRAFT_9819 [Trametes versicolor]
MPRYHARQVVYRVLCAFFTLYRADQDVRVENGLPIPPSRLTIERRGRGSAGRLGTACRYEGTEPHPDDHKPVRQDQDPGRIAWWIVRFGIVRVRYASHGLRSI